MIEFGDGKELGEFPQGDPLDVGREGPGFPFLEKQGGLPACEGTDHQLGMDNNATRSGVKLRGVDWSHFHLGTKAVLYLR
jgi:hypothetical protein